MQVLNSLEKTFDSFSLKTKIELFLFPVVIASIFTYFINSINLSVQNIKTYKVYESMNIKMKTKIVTILKDIDMYAKKHKIDLESSSNDEMTIDITILTDIKKQIEFLKFIEDYNGFSKINLINILDDRLQIQVDFDKFYKKRQIDISKQLYLLEKDNINNFELNAIVDGKVFIDQNWYVKGDFIQEYKIIQINKNSIVLKKRFKKVEIKL